MFSRGELEWGRRRKREEPSTPGGRNSANLRNGEKPGEKKRKNRGEGEEWRGKWERMYRATSRFQPFHSSRTLSLPFSLCRSFPLVWFGDACVPSCQTEGEISSAPLSQQMRFVRGGESQGRRSLRSVEGDGERSNYPSFSRMWHLKNPLIVSQSNALRKREEEKKKRDSDCFPGVRGGEVPSCCPPPFCSCWTCSLFLLHPVSSLPLTRTLSLSFNLSASIPSSSPHWQSGGEGGGGGLSDSVSGADCLLLPLPSLWEGLQPLGASGRSRHEPAGCNVFTTWKSAGKRRSGDSRGRRQHEESIPPTGCFGSCRLQPAATNAVCH